MLEEAARSATIAGGDAAEADLRLSTLLADGSDHEAAKLALARDWQLAVPLPFGRALNTAINAAPQSANDARAILAGEAPEDDATAQRVAAIEELSDKAILFELADRDAVIEAHFLATLDDSECPQALSTFIHEGSDRTLLAGRIMIEQSDVMIAVWDGASTSSIGGTGHTAMAALIAGIPVVWIDPACPEDWRIIHTPEALTLKTSSAGVPRAEQLRALVQASVGLLPSSLKGSYTGLDALDEQSWRDASSISSHAYRRVEALFGDRSWRGKLGSVRQTYEKPSDIAAGSGKPLLSALATLPGGDPALPAKVGQEVLTRFTWANGIASHLSNLFRSGMVLNFTLGPLAILAGLLYIPLVPAEQKWIFAAVELALLLAIVINTVSGQRARLHGRWLETRRVAEYLRHAPGLLALGVARPLGAWPEGLRTHWPEWYARHVIRGIGLPQVKVDHAYLRASAQTLRDHLIIPQLEYHEFKAARLARAHHAIETLAERLFALAVFLVALYLAMFGASKLGFIDPDFIAGIAKWFTVAAVAFPTIAGALAAIGYFGDFDRFADISQGTAAKLAAVNERVGLYLEQGDDTLSYAQLAELARQTDETTFAEIQAWQAVFSGKRTTVPA